jgi:RimJ/RimL family protein N-acetyltransferase
MRRATGADCEKPASGRTPHKVLFVIKLGTRSAVKRDSVNLAAPVQGMLRTKRLLLRPFEPGDIADALAYRDDAEFARFLPHVPQPFTRNDAEAFVALNIAEPWDRSPTFAVILSGRVIGTVNLEVDPAKRTAMLGYAIGRAWWGQGIATEAAQAAMAWGITTFGLTRVWASTDVRHLRSHCVLEKLNMQREVVRPGEHPGRDGQVIDEVVYGVDLA